LKVDRQVLLHELGHAVAAALVQARDVQIRPDPSEPTGLLTRGKIPEDAPPEVHARIVAGGLALSVGVKCDDDLRDLESYPEAVQDAAMRWARAEVVPRVLAFTETELREIADLISESGGITFYGTEAVRH
jgi:hypothetical protein